MTVRGVCWSTSANPTTTNSHTTDGSGTGVFVSSITGLTLNTLYYVRAYATNSVGTAYGNEVSFTTLNTWSCGSAFTINHIAGAVAPVTKTVTYGTVTNIPGETSKCWITSNLGADHQATAVNDATEASAGWYWQFNRKQGYKHDGTTRTPNTTWITTINENLDWEVANDPCTLELGSGWRIPTVTEWFNVNTSGGWGDWNGPWNSGLKMHAAGYILNPNGSLGNRGSWGYCWSITQYDANFGWHLFFTNDGSGMGGITKANGLTLRCLQGTPSPNQPTVSTTTITNINQTAATSGGNVTSDGGATVTVRGVCWSTSSNPATTNSHTSDGSGIGTFVSNLTALTANTLYYVRAYATNSAGTAYGNEVTFTTLSSVTLAIVTTTAATSITQTTATSGGNVTSDGGATVTVRGVCWSTLSNPTTANSHTSDGSGNGTFTSNLFGLTASTFYYIRAYATNSVGTAYGNEVSFTTLYPWTCGSSITINHVVGSVAPVTKTVIYGTVTNISGETSKCWITSNLGADHQANSKDDATEASAGWYWQFNRKQGFKHDGTTRTPNTTWISTINENSDWTSVNDPCTIELGSGWRLPTSIEWNNVDASGSWTDWNGPWNSGLKIHAAGYLFDSNGMLIGRGSYGVYWSSVQVSNTNSWTLQFTSGYSYMSSNIKTYGSALRCLKE